MKRLFALAVLLAAGTAVLFAVPSNHYLFLPDPARPLDPLVEVEGEEDGPEKGGVYMVDILVRRASLFERLFPGLQDGASLHSEDAVNPGGVSDRQRRQESLQQMSRSQQIAAAVALEAVGRDVGVKRLGAEVAAVVPDRPAAAKLEVGDVIVQAGGEPVKTREDLLRLMEPVEPGASVDLVVLREQKRLRLRVGTVADEDEPDRAVFGVLIRQAAEFDFPLEIEIDAGDVGGPSAGLAFALDIVDALGREVDRGRRIAVTGELGLEGEVGPIGGIKQKTIGAREAGAVIFVVPEENAEEARRYAERLEIVGVKTFREALAHLATG